MKQNLYEREKTSAARRRGADATLRRISEVTGFACSTVSAVLNNDDRCYASVETKKKILKAAEELKYHPNLLYRSLRTSKTNTIGFIVPNLQINVAMTNIELIESLAWDAGYHLFIGYSQNNIDKEEALMKNFVSRRVDGIILVVGADREDRPELRYLIEQNFPLVTIRQLHYHSCSFVSTDYYGGGQMVARHLNELGHRNVLLFDLFPNPAERNLRMEGFRDAAKKCGMNVEEVFMTKKKADADRVFRAEDCIMRSVEIFRKVLKDSKATGIFASNDEMASGVIKAAHELGIRVPEELSVIGFDDAPVSALAYVPITTVRQKREEISNRVFSILMRKIERGETENVSEYIAPELIVRASAGPVKR